MKGIGAAMGLALLAVAAPLSADGHERSAHEQRS